MSPMKFAGSSAFTALVVAAALTGSSSVFAQATAQEPLDQATQLLGAISAPPQSDAARPIATLKRDFADFVAGYLAGGKPATASAAAGVVGTSGVAGDRSDWRAKYQRVEADLAALLGPSSGGQPVPGASLDPATRSQLETVRSHLQLFYAATMSAPDGNPVAHTGAPQASPAQGSASRPPVAPTGEAPQTPPPAAPQPAGAAPGPAPVTTGTPTPLVETDLGMALTLLDRMQRILDAATTEPGKVKLDRADVDEIRAEIAQVRSMLAARRR